MASGLMRAGICRRSPRAWAYLAPAARLALPIWLACAAGLVFAATEPGGIDPFRTRTLTSAAPEQGLHTAGAQAPCAAEGDPGAALSLADVVGRALCNNPQTRAAWASALLQAAQVGIARSAYLPAISATGSVERTRSSNGSLAGSGAKVYNQGAGSIDVSYVLYDFGARDAALDGALQTMASADFAQDTTLQKVILSALQAYYQLFGSRAAVDAMQEAERASQESLRAASARYEAGTATPSDRLLAQTAFSQAVLNRIQAQGVARAAEGTLANVMGADADRPFRYAPPDIRAPDGVFDADLAKLIAAARGRRSDLAAADAQVAAARAAVRAATASGLPTISVGANVGRTDTGIVPIANTGAIGLQVNVPLFSGFETTYRIRAAKAQLENQSALRDSVRSQVALDVWQAYYSLETGTQAVRSAADLEASAEASARVALGRYKAGAGTILDALTAQSSLASARLQYIQAQYSWYVLKAALAQALGRLDFDAAATPNAKP